MSGASGRAIEVRAFVRMMPWEGSREQSPSRESRVQFEELPNGLGGCLERRATGQSPVGRAPSPCGSGVDRVMSTKLLATFRGAESMARRRLAVAPRAL